jgi:hypothetical protein
VTRLLILVEGPTEERFVNTVLRGHLRARSIEPISRILVTRYVASGRNFKGGVANWNQIKRDLQNLLRDTHAAGITTLLDYYGLPGDVPGMSTRPGRSPGARVAHVEEAIGRQFSDRRLRPYLMLHEFEAMLFTNIKKWEHRFDDIAAIARLKRDVAGLEPEGINETPQGAPSKRILRRLEDYEKPFHGPDALQDIGLEAIRGACPHFAAWLTWAEGLAGDEDQEPEEAPADEAERDGDEEPDEDVPVKRGKKR